MPYPEQRDYGNLVIPKSGATTTAVNLAAAAGQWAGYLVVAPAQATRVFFIVTTAVTASVTAPAVAIKRRPTIGSTSGAVTLGTMTIPSGAAVGQVFYQDIVYGASGSTKYSNAGEEISLEVTVQASDAVTAAGAGFMTFEFECVSDSAANQTNMINKLA